ncbi:hypothetical protein CAC42_3615 [Sphaceloma murrayae]|uniref:RNase III domain-containing protein n=1 Tax=Sphaceloma murrayae TaxID=2082308 RepID=A0A2K1QTA9_9PEZI|nr:hypothetical protein CAC42_3615 [Sphaceloma murrayae]
MNNADQIRQHKVTAIRAMLGQDLDEGYVWEALQMPGSGVFAVHGRRLHKGHRPLAGVGDRVAALLVAGDAYHQNVDVGTTSRLISDRCSNNRLAQVCLAHGLDKHINVNPSHVGPLGQTTTSATVEALIGAAYHSGGLDMARRVMERLGLI